MRKKWLLLPCVLLFVCALRLAVPGEEKRAESPLVVLPLTVHPHWGRDLPGASRMVWDAPRLWFARRFGVFWLEPEGGRTGYLPLPAAAQAGGIQSFTVVLGNLWVATADGLVFRRGADGTWLRQPVRLHESSVLARGRTGLVAGSGRELYRIFAPRMPDKPDFSFPPGVDLRIRSFLDNGFRSFVGSDAGLFRVGANGEWEGLGTREHLAKAHVHDIAADDGHLVLATSRVQHARLPANVKLTGIGTFVYNYFQDRWERLNGRPDPQQRLFIEHNKKNRAIPPGGIWICRPPLPLFLNRAEFDRFRDGFLKKGVAAGRTAAEVVALLAAFYGREGEGYRLREAAWQQGGWILEQALLELGYRESAERFDAEGRDFHRVVRLGAGDFLAASLRGLFRFRKMEDKWVLAPVAEHATLLVDDIVLAGKRVCILSGERLYMSALAAWGGVPDGTPGGLSGDGSRTDAPIDPRLPEPERFRLQMERYLRSLRSRTR